MKRLRRTPGLSIGQAERLTRWAARRRPDGTRGPLARWALRRLDVATEQRDPHTAGAVWLAWLRYPEDWLWELMARQRGRMHLVRDTLEAGMDPRRPAADRAAIGAFCARHGFAPELPRRHAVFLRLTGQTTQHRALDPDGTLLAEGYRWATEATRAAMRQALTGTGDLDLVRVLVGADRPDRAAHLTDAEVDHLARELADGGDWPRLWRLVGDLRVDRAVALMPLFAGWRPADEAGRALFPRLAAASPATVTAAYDALQAAALTRIQVPAYVSSVSFAPDLTAVAVAASSSDHYYGAVRAEARRSTVDVFAVPDGRRIEHRESTRFAATSVVHLGGAVVAAETARAGQPPPNRLVRYDRPRTTVLWESTIEHGLDWELVRTRHGFAGAGDLDHAVFLGDGQTAPRRTTLDSLGLNASDWGCALAGDPASGRIAIGVRGRHDLSILEQDDLDLRVVARDEDQDADLVKALVF